MEPTLAEGDWLLVDPLAFEGRPPEVGALVLLPDPREPARLLVKRVALRHDDGRVEVTGDAPLASTDSRTFGSVPPDVLLGRPWFRYWPPSRAGRVR